MGLCCWAAAAGIFLTASSRVIGVVTAFGAGMLIRALAFSLTQEAFRKGGMVSVTVRAANRPDTSCCCG